MRRYLIEPYISADTGREPFTDWLGALRDGKGKVAIARRLMRIEQGNFGDHRFCSDGVWELRIDVGAGYRVYYAVCGQRVVLLLCGGDKRTQCKDVDRAVDYWRDWQRRSDDAKQTV